MSLEDVRLDSETDTDPGSESKNDGTKDKLGGSHDTSTGSSAGKPVKKKRDPSMYNLVEAAQYGLLERCRELIEKEGVDVNKGDQENITALHWAAINNRIPVVSYFLQKGADVNAIGGELKSPPIHWATRQGHLAMVVHLMRYGALAEIIDGEGINCLHIAAQYGLTAITAYYISCRTPIFIDCRDTEGRTPLMHAATRANRSHDTSRLLVSLGADMSATDKNGNTALHHAATNLNFVATRVLIEAGSPLEVKNKDGKTPYDLAMENQNSFGMDQILMARQKQHPRGIKEHLTKNERFVWWLMLLYPVFLLGMLAWAGVLAPNWWSYMIITTLLGFVTRKFVEFYLPVMPNNSPMIFGIVVGTKFWLYYTAIVFFQPTGVLVHYWWMHFATFFTVFIFYKTYRSDPGVIPRSRNIQEVHRVLMELCEKGEYTESSFCTTCLVRRPLRSKHCSSCDRCVARFDHHCPWVSNCIGLKNHKIFLLYLLCLLVMLTWGLRASVQYVFTFYPADHGNFFVKAYHYVVVDPWVGFIMVMCSIHLMWVYILLIVQLFQMICQGVTTNELRNRYKYQHFSKTNPFHRGILANAGEFLGCTCCQKRDEKLDWTKTYSLPKHYSRDKGAGGSDSKGSNVRIPLPFSRTWDPKQDSLQSTRNKTRRSRGPQQNSGYLSSDDDTCRQQFSANRQFNI